MIGGRQVLANLTHVLRQLIRLLTQKLSSGRLFKKVGLTLENGKATFDEDLHLLRRVAFSRIKNYC